MGAGFSAVSIQCYPLPDPTGVGGGFKPRNLFLNFGALMPPSLSQCSHGALLSTVLFTLIFLLFNLQLSSVLRSDAWQ